MNSFEQNRRSILYALGVVGMSHIVSHKVCAHPAPQNGYVVAAGKGEHLIHFRDGGDIFINASSATGSNRMALGTQQVKRGAGIPVHRHLQMDEAFYVLEGSGFVTLDDVSHPFERGATIFIPAKSWHGFTNPDDDIVLLWTVAPQGLESFFRETCSPPGTPPKPLSRQQIKQIALKYGTEFR